MCVYKHYYKKFFPWRPESGACATGIIHSKFLWSNLCAEGLSCCWRFQNCKSMPVLFHPQLTNHQPPPPAIRHTCLQHESHWNSEVCSKVSIVKLTLTVCIGLVCSLCESLEPSRCQSFSPPPPPPPPPPVNPESLSTFYGTFLETFCTCSSSVSVFFLGWI